MIRLEGLTKEDVQICNLLWNCDSVDSVNAMVRAMPPAYKQRAETLRELMIAAQLDTVERVDEAVTSYLQRIAG